MFRNAFFFASLWLFISTATASAMEKTDYIDTNRPSFMFSPLVVPRASVQLENGLLERFARQRIRSFDIAETQVRVGLTERTEFQMFVPTFLLIDKAEEGTIAGVTDLQEVGFKHQLPPFKKFQLSLIPSIDIPTGTRRLGGPNSGVHPVLRAPWSYQLTDGLSIMGMQSLLLLNSGRDLQYQPNLMLNKSFGPKVITFIEYAGFFTHHLPNIQFAHFGGEYRPKRNHQADLHFGFGLNSTSPTAFVGAGYSYRFDKLSW
jgi:hypothetical protein